VQYLDVLDAAVDVVLCVDSRVTQAVVIDVSLLHGPTTLLSRPFHLARCGKRGLFVKRTVRRSWHVVRGSYVAVRHAETVRHCWRRRRIVTRLTNAYRSLTSDTHTDTHYGCTGLLNL